jgi:glycosyltransferase involved in cell wall biosynthesis
MPTSDLSLAGVTVVIPCYNYAHFLPQAIESCLNQDHSPMEVLVVDDESTDDSVAVANGYGEKVRCIRQKNQGVGVARNTGMREAAHVFVIFLDADDMLAPGAVRRFLKTYLDEAVEPGVLAGSALMVDRDTVPLDRHPHPPLFAGVRQILLEEAIMFTPFAPTVLAKKDFLLSLGGFETDDRTYRGSEDKSMWIKVAASGRPLLLLGEVVVHYRVHGSSMSHNGLRQIASSHAILQRAQNDFGGQLSGAAWNRAWAFSYFQAAIIHSEIKREKDALMFLVRSFMLAPVIRHETLRSRYGSLFRVKRFLKIIRDGLQSRLGLAPAV